MVQGEWDITKGFFKKFIHAIMEQCKMSKEKKPKTVTINHKVFLVPAMQLYCKKCKTTNYFYEDDKPPYQCDNCGKELTAEN